MHQILGIRTFKIAAENRDVKKDVFFEKNIVAPSIEDILRKPKAMLQNLPEEEHYNLFYTIAHCTDNKREFKALDYIAFDLDGMDETLGLDLYITHFCTFFNLARKKIGIVSSGHGLHFLIKLDYSINSKEELEKLKLHYHACCHQFTSFLTNLKLKGKLDTTIFNAAALLRMPGSINSKPGKPDSLCIAIEYNPEPLSFHLPKHSGIPTIDKKDVVPPGILKKYPEIDSKAVLKGCSFIQHCHENPNDISEGQWYAALSIVGRLEDGKALAHAMSKGYEKYSHDETETKLRQALKASGPRTCENIESMHPGCQECPWHKKIISPIIITSDEHIPTKRSGFYKWYIGSKGQEQKEPCYEDLLKYFEQKHPFVGVDNSRSILVWNGKFYEPFLSIMIENFAEVHFDPKPNNNMVKEFYQKVMRHNPRPYEWFIDSTAKMLNFQNGVLNIETNTFESHAKDRGFRYCLPYDYDPLAKAPAFETMLHKITKNDEALSKILLEFMGYALSDDIYWLHKALVLVGTGSNGKSTFIRTLTKLVGKESYSTIRIGDLRHEYSRQLLDGKLFNISEETPDKALVDSDIFKDVTSGGELQVREPYKPPYKMICKAKIIMTCNKMPTVTDTSHGFYRRLLIAPFEASILETDHDFDPNIAEKLDHELPGILNMALAAYKRVKLEKKFSQSLRSDHYLERYKLESDTFTRWFDDNVTECEGDEFLKFQDLYDDYVNYARGWNAEIKGYQGFMMALRSLIPDFEERYKRIQANGTRHRGLIKMKCGPGQGGSSRVLAFPNGMPLS